MPDVPRPGKLPPADEPLHELLDDHEPAEAIPTEGSPAEAGPAEASAAGSVEAPAAAGAAPVVVEAPRAPVSAVATPPAPVSVQAVPSVPTPPLAIPALLSPGAAAQAVPAPAPTQQDFTRLIDSVERVILGKRETIEVVVAALLARGHVLLEDVPGVGKTVLARALARSIDGVFRRIQCTPDLLPSDVTGVSLYNPKELSFEFRPGPVFAHVVLADEINRATPRTQSALLEAMDEHQVSVDGTSYALPEPFFLIATQNPIEMAGTFPLPEAQLDRFLVRVALGYPDDQTESRMMLAQRELHPLHLLEAVTGAAGLLELQHAVTRIHVEEEIANYVQRLVAETRKHAHAAYGASPRGALALMRAAQAMAAIQGQAFVTPDHVKRLAVAVLAHRIVVKPRSRVQGIDGARIVLDVLPRIEVPIDYKSSG